jgi:hypothetical protein
MLKALSDWLSATPLSSFEQDTGWVIPALQCIHILAIAVVMGSMGILELRAFGLAGRTQRVSAMTARFLGWTWAALAVLFLTGALMVTGEPSRSLLNPTFQIKMALLVFAGVITVLAGRAAAASPAPAHETPPAGVKALLTIALLLWTSVAVAGRWIAYLDPNVS